MAKPKSTVKAVSVTNAGAAHNCRHNRKHRILKGEKRLTIREGRSSKNYCRECALLSLTKDIDLLSALVLDLREISG